MIYQNLCTRCGRERIKVKNWEEDIGYRFPVLVTENKCPNIACQKIVDSNNKKQQNKIMAMQVNKQKRLNLMYEKRKMHKQIKKINLAI